MEVLPDIVGPEPRIVFCGQAGAESITSREHYYETPGNSFWESLHACGLVPDLLGPQDDHRLPEHGLGLTDLVGHIDPGTGRQRAWVEVEELLDKVERWAPDWLAFTSKGAAQEAARAIGRPPPRLLGTTEWYVARTQVFVLPGTSGANRRRDYDGRPTRLGWWRELAELSDDVAPPGG